jgi:hypothetical protein
MTSDSATAVASQQSIKAYVGSIQTVNTMDAAVDTGTTAMTLADSIPQNTEGDEYFTLAVTPQSATNKLKIDVVFQYSHTVANSHVICALFQDTTANALAVACEENHVANKWHTMKFTHYMTSGTTDETTFKVRAGGTTGATLSFNGAQGSRKFGGVAASSITITELKP